MPPKKPPSTDLRRVSEDQFSKIIASCMDLAKQSAELSKTKSEKERRHADRLVALLQEANEKRPRLVKRASSKSQVSKKAGSGKGTKQTRKRTPVTQERRR